MDPVLLGEILSVTMFLCTIGAVLIGYPVAFTLAGVGLLFAGIGIALGVFDVAILRALAERYFGTMTNETLVAVPLFVFMGVMLERSKIAESLLTTMGELFGELRGGLGYSVVIVGALLAASTGIVGATVVTMGLLSLPAMIRAGYDPRLAAGTICRAPTSRHSSRSATSHRIRFRWGSSSRARCCPGSCWWRSTSAGSC